MLALPAVSHTHTVLPVQTRSVSLRRGKGSLSLLALHYVPPSPLPASDRTFLMPLPTGWDSRLSLSNRDLLRNSGLWSSLDFAPPSAPGATSSGQPNTSEKLVSGGSFQGLGGSVGLPILSQLLSRSFTETYYDKNGEPVTITPNYTNHCFYHGEVRGHAGSWVVLSTCTGVSQRCSGSAIRALLILVTILAIAILKMHQTQIREFVKLHDAWRVHVLSLFC
ncbi:ADA33 protein, partial [Polypterus senegalus]